MEHKYLTKEEVVEGIERELEGKPDKSGDRMSELFEKAVGKRTGAQK